MHAAQTFLKVVVIQAFSQLDMAIRSVLNTKGSLSTSTISRREILFLTSFLNELNPSINTKQLDTHHLTAEYDTTNAMEAAGKDRDTRAILCGHTEATSDPTSTKQHRCNQAACGLQDLLTIYHQQDLSPAKPTHMGTVQGGSWVSLWSDLGRAGRVKAAE